MSTKISLSFLAITGALLSAEGTYAQASLPNSQALVINNLSDAQVSGVNNPTNLSLIDREAVQFTENNQNFGSKIDPIDRNDVNNRSKDREESEIGTAKSGGKSDRNRTKSVLENDGLDRDLAPARSGEPIVGNDRATDRQQSEFDREDLARRNLSVPNLSSPKSSSVDLARRNLSIPNLSSPQQPKSADSVRRNLSIPNLSPPKSDDVSSANTQTNVFSSDVAVPTSKPKSSASIAPTEQAEFSIAIPVPPPRNHQKIESHLVAPAFKVASTAAPVSPKLDKSDRFRQVGAHQSNVFSSDVAVLDRGTKIIDRSTKIIDRSNKIIDRSTKIFDRSTKVTPLPVPPPEISIAIPVSAPRTQKVVKVPSVTRIPVIAKAKPTAPVVPAVAMGQAGYPTATAKTESIAIPVPMGQAGYPTATTKTKSIAIPVPMGQAGYPTATTKTKSIAIPVVTAVPMGQGGYPTTARSTPTPIPTHDSGVLGSSAVAIYPLLNPAPITSRFGWRTHPLTGSRRFHSGVDIGAPAGAPVVATGAGTIVSAGWKGGYGKAVVIEHNGVQQTLYGHLSEISVQTGQTVAQGTVIGLVGSTGNSTGPHLHFETRTPDSDGWTAIDPSEDIKYAVDSLQRSMPYVRRDLPPGL